MAACTGCLPPSTAVLVPSLSITFPLTGRTAPWSSGKNFISWRWGLALTLLSSLAPPTIVCSPVKMCSWRLLLRWFHSPAWRIEKCVINHELCAVCPYFAATGKSHKLVTLNSSWVSMLLAKLSPCTELFWAGWTVLFFMFYFRVQLPDIQRQWDWNGSQSGRQPHAGVGGYRPRGFYWCGKIWLFVSNLMNDYLSVFSQTNRNDQIYLCCQKMASGSSNTGLPRRWLTLSTLRTSGSTRRWSSSSSSRESPSSTSSTSSLLVCSSPHSASLSSTYLLKVSVLTSWNLLLHTQISLIGEKMERCSIWDQFKYCARILKAGIV